MSTPNLGSAQRTLRDWYPDETSRLRSEAKVQTPDQFGFGSDLVRPLPYEDLGVASG